MKNNIQRAISEEYRKAGKITNILMDKDINYKTGKELRNVKDKCFKKIDFYKNLNKALQNVG